MLLSSVKIPLSFSIAAWTVLALASIASPPARAEPAAAYDRCDYMNHDSKAYKACIADAAQAKLRAEAAPASAGNAAEAKARGTAKILDSRADAAAPLI
jgi:hypothetical protein